MIRAHKEIEKSIDEDGNEVWKYIPLSQEEQDNIRKKIATGLGSKSDSKMIEIFSPEITRTLEKYEITGWDEFRLFMGEHGSMLGLVFLGLVALLTIRSTIIKVMPDRPKIAKAMDEPEMPDLASVERPDDAMVIRSRQVQERVQNIIDENPEKAASIVKRWLVREG